MSEHEQHPEENPEPGYPSGDETLPEESPPEGEASLEKGDEWGPKRGQGGHETHGTGGHDHPNE